MEAESLNIVLVGDESVGKTSLLMTYFTPHPAISRTDSQKSRKFLLSIIKPQPSSKSINTPFTSNFGTSSSTQGHFWAIGRGKREEGRSLQ